MMRILIPFLCVLKLVTAYEADYIIRLKQIQEIIQQEDGVGAATCTERNWLVKEGLANVNSVKFRTKLLETIVDFEPSHTVCEKIEKVVWIRDQVHGINVNGIFYEFQHQFVPGASPRRLDPTIELAERPATKYRDDWTTKNETLTLILDVRPLSGVHEALTESFLTEIFDEMNLYYLSMSNGRHAYKYVLHNKVIRIDAFSDAVCAGSEEPNYSDLSDQSLDQVVSDLELADHEALFEIYDRVVFSLVACRVLPWGGLGQVVGDGLSWINGQRTNKIGYLAVATHEFGHNLGLQHGSYLDRGYGNRFTTMGSGYVPNAHFLIGAKVAMEWIDLQSQIYQFQRDGVCKYSTCLQSSTVSIYAHDEGSYQASRRYGLKIYTADAGEVVWVEFRTLFQDLTPGAIVFWASDSSGRYTNFGPNQLVDYETTTSSQMDATIPVGSSYVYDNDFVISVLSVQSNKLEVKVNFLTVQEKNQIKTHVASNLPTIACNTSQEIKHGEVSLFHFPIGHPGTVSINVTANCSDGSVGIADAGIYVYDRFPLQLFIDETAEFNLSKNVSTLERLGRNVVYDKPIAGSCTGVCDVDIQGLISYFSGVWQAEALSQLNGIPVYSFGGRYYLVFVPNRFDSEKGTQMTWILGNEISETPSSVWGYMFVNSNKTLDKLGDSDFISARVWESGWVEKTNLPDITCVEEKAQLTDMRGAEYTEFIYNDFTTDNYLLVNDPAGDMSVTVTCNRLHCAANHYEDQGQCLECPTGLVSDPGSLSASACYTDCPNVWVQAKTVTSRQKNLDGIYTYFTDISGAPAFEHFGRHFRRDEYNNHNAMKLFQLYGWWALGPEPDYHSVKIWITGDTHPHPARINNHQYSVTCLCSDHKKLMGSCSSECPTGELPEPTRPDTCFTPCEKIDVSGYGEFDGTFEFYSFQNAKPAFRNVDNHDIKLSEAGYIEAVWVFSSSHGTLKVDTDNAFWPTARTGITCSQNAGSVNIYKHFNMFDNDETFAPTAQPSAQPSTNPTPAPTQTPTYPPTEAPTFPPTAAPTHSPPLTCDTICLVGIGAGVLAISIVVLLCIRRKTKKVTPQTALQKPK